MDNPGPTPQRRSARLALLNQSSQHNQTMTDDTNPATDTETATATTEVFATNPFSTNINPATTNGLKLYQSATANRSDDEKLTTSIAKQKEFIDAMKQDATQYSWGILTSQITDGTVKSDILRDFKSLTVDKVRTFTNNIFHHRTSTDLPTTPTNPTMFDIDPATIPEDRKIFYQRVRANIIGLRIINSLSKTSLASLKLKSRLYLWKSSTGEEFYDGPTMLQLCVEKVNPTTRVGVSHLKDALRTAKLATYSYNVLDMTDKMQSYYDEILEKGTKHDDFILDLFRALLTGKNTIFTSFIQRKHDAWDEGKDILSDDLIRDAVTKYQNMVALKTWDQSEPGNSKIAALTTQLKELQDSINSNKTTTTPSNNDFTSTSKTGFLAVAEWRKTKSFGDTVTKDGKTWHWCSKQHNGGKGMYVTHKEEDHTDWQDRKKSRASTQDSSKLKDSTNTTSTSTNKSMTLSDNLKAAMVSKFKCSSDDALKLWNDVVKQSN
jgi:hypothetical protein